MSRTPIRTPVSSLADAAASRTVSTTSSGSSPAAVCSKRGEVQLGVEDALLRERADDVACGKAQGVPRLQQVDLRPGRSQERRQVVHPGRTSDRPCVDLPRQPRHQLRCDQVAHGEVEMEVQLDLAERSDDDRRDDRHAPPPVRRDDEVRRARTTGSGAGYATTPRGRRSASGRTGRRAVPSCTTSARRSDRSSGVRRDQLGSLVLLAVAQPPSVARDGRA
jgi:hypothetical protein